MRIVFIVEAPSHDFRTNLHITRGCNVNGEAKAIKQLRAEFPFLRVHGAHEHEIGGAGVGNAIAFDGHGTGRGGVEKRIYQMVGQKVDFVNVEHTPVRLGKQTGLIFGVACGEDFFNVQGADHTILSSADGEVNQRGVAKKRGKCSNCCGFCGAFFAAHHNTPDAGRNGGEDESQPELVLPHHCRKWIARHGGGVHCG